jgi:hypothetical protein
MPIILNNRRRPMHLLVAITACILFTHHAMESQASDKAMVFLDSEATYWVDWETLEAPNRWEPGVERFPADLAERVSSARDLVLKSGITNRFDLQKLRINRLAVSRAERERRGLTPSYFTNEWVISCEFLVQRNLDFSMQQFQRVVSLMDGTIPVKRLRPTSPEEPTARIWKKDLPTRRPKTTQPLQTTQSLTTLQDALNAVEASLGSSYRELYQPDFRLPSVEWNPKHSFPVNLSELTLKAERQLNDLKLPETAYLEEIAFKRLHPAAVSEAGQDPSLHWHWIIENIFRGSKRTYVISILLDGRIVAGTLPHQDR